MIPSRSMYPKAFDRFDAHVNINDVHSAIEEFRAANGRLPTKLYLNHDIAQSLSGTPLPDIEIIEHGGTLSWELGLSTDGLPEDKVLMVDTPSAPQSTPEPQIDPPAVIKEKSPVLSVVTENSPIKPPYRRHGQFTIFDKDIDKTISDALANSKTARERSSRTISSLLQSRGIKVSHMTISRRIRKIKEEEESHAQQEKNFTRE